MQPVILTLKSTSTIGTLSYRFTCHIYIREVDSVSIEYTQICCFHQLSSYVMLKFVRLSLEYVAIWSPPTLDTDVISIFNSCFQVQKYVEDLDWFMRYYFHDVSSW
jgi:hypothetical protein